MPSELMDERRGFSPLYVPPSAQPSSFYSYEIHFPTERQVGFWKPESVPDHGGIEGMALKLGNGPFASPTIEKKLQPSLGMINSSKCADSHFLKEQNARFSLEDLWKPSSDVFCRSDLLQQPANYANGNKTALNVVRSENNLLSNSLSELFNKKVSLTSNDTFFGNSVDAIKFNFDEDDGLFESLKEMEAQTIGNLLPDDDDLLDYIAQPNTSDDVEEDIFCSIGGMEIEEVDRAGGCEHPSRPLFVRTVNTDSSNVGTLVIFNLDSSVSNENLYQIFGAYGQIKEIREAPHKKFIDFYDVRASEAAFHALNMREIAGKRIKLEKYCHSGTTGRSLKQIFSHEPQKDEIGGFHQQASKNTSLTGSYAFNSGHVSTGNTTFNGIPSTAPHSFSPIRSPSIGNHGNFDFHPMPNFHPHSLPECHDNMIPQGIPYNSVNSTGFGGHSFEYSEMVIGASGNRRYPQHQFAGNNNSFHAPSVPMMWPNSSQFHGYSTPPPHMLYPGAHHVGSAPTANPSMVSMGFSSSPTPHHNVFPCINGNFMEPPIPQQRCHIFHGNGVIAMPSAFDAPNDCVRSRRNDSNTGSNQADSKRQYELDIGLIISGKDSRTTLMIKNIPNKYTSKMLLAAIDENHRGTYDFVYLPIDFKNKCNVGYAFINIIDPLQIIPFHKAFNGKKWEKFNSEKVASLAYARIQGKAALIAHFQNSSLMNEDKRCRPILFHSDGPNAGDQEPFPTGINIRPRLGRSRNQLNHNNEDHHHHYYHHHQDSPLNSSTEENST